MKTILPEQISSVEEAKVFLTNLYNNGEAYHPEDDALTLVSDLFTEEEAIKLNELMSQIYCLPENDVKPGEPMGFDPCGFILNLDPEYVAMIEEDEREYQKMLEEEKAALDEQENE